jgi:hypothetical protein
MTLVYYARGGLSSFELISSYNAANKKVGGIQATPFKVVEFAVEWRAGCRRQQDAGHSPDGTVVMWSAGNAGEIPRGNSDIAPGAAVVV